MENCSDARKPENVLDENYMTELQNWLDCQEDARRIKREAKELERAGQDDAMEDLAAELEDVRIRDRQMKRLEKKTDIKQNRYGLYVVVCVVILVFWFLYYFILERDTTTFYIILAVFFICVLFLILSDFYKYGPRSTMLKLIS